jgi:hypothetical protein
VHITDVATWSVAPGGLRRPPRRHRHGTWLATPAQRLAEAVGGAVFHDDIGELTELRHRLWWYPDDV